MSVHVSKRTIGSASTVAALGVAALIGSVGVASADVSPGTYTSFTVSAGSVLLEREARVEGQELVLIGRYPIHQTDTGGYVDLIPGHRVFLNSDGHGGYTGPAFLGPFRVGEIVLAPRG